MTTTQQVIDKLVTGLSTITGISRVYDAPPRAINNPDLPAIMIDVEDAVHIDKGTGNPYTVREFVIYIFVEPITYGRYYDEGFKKTITIMDNVSTALAGDYFVNFTDINASMQVRRTQEGTTKYVDSGVVKLQHHDNREYWGVVYRVQYKYPVG